jgi:PAS domain S-box-containing protein
VAALALCVCALAGAVGAPARAAAQDTDDRQHILMLFSNEPHMPASEAVFEGFRNALPAEFADRRVLFSEYLDANRFPGATQERMLTFLQAKYAAIRIDVVVPVGPEALRFLGQHQSALFPRAATVFVAVSDAGLQGLTLPPNTTGVISRFDIIATLDLALALQPNAQRLIVVTGASDFDREWEQRARDKLRPLESRLQVTYLAGLAMPDLLREVAQAPANAIILFLSVLEDGTGKILASRDVVERVAAVASAPVYSVYDTYLGRGIVGGYIASLDSMGAEAARLTLRVLAGAAPRSLPPSAVGAMSFIVDWRQLERWGLSESRLPPGTIVRFQEPPLWSRYRWHIVALVAVMVLQALLIAGLLMQARRRKHAEQSLRNTEERMSLAVESTNLGLWQLDVPTAQLWATDTCRALLGLDPREALTRQSFINVCHPDDRERVMQVCDAALAQGRSDEQEYRVVHGDGSVRWVLDRARTVHDAAGRLLRMTGVVIDITDRKQAEQALRESEERYRNVVETQTELICRFKPDTTLTFVNDAYCRFFERSREQLVDTKFIELVPPSARPALFRHLESVVSNPRTQTYEHEVLRPDGSIGWQQWFDHAIVDGQGRTSEIQGIGRDITTLKRAELEAEERRKEVTHLTRVAILGELSGALAHELNQPLTAILSNAQAAQRLLAKTPVDLDEVREILTDIGNEDKRAGNVINRLRALMKKGEARLLPLDLNALAEDVLELAHSELVERNIAVKRKLAPGLPDIRGDRVQLQQVVLNLIMNACEAMNGNGTVDRRRIEVSTVRDGNSRLRLTVADRGPGIPPELLDRIFEPFMTTKTDGLGLGLSICRSIVAAHDGRLWGVNNPDGGATFSVSLPVCEGGHA